MDVRNLGLYARPMSEVFGDQPELVYEMPKFQREYVWKKEDWEKFFKDITAIYRGHFFGTIIGIEPNSLLDNDPKIIVIDGQQRLTTMSLYLAALYSHIRYHRANLNEDQQTDFTTLRRRLVQRSNKKSLRVVPQSQNNNFDDYRWLMGQIEVTVEKYDKPSRVETRKIYKAYNYFYKEIGNLIEDEVDKIEFLLDLVDKTMSAILVVITVKSYSDAFQLFESLNNNGQPLTKIDLLKNIILSRVSETDNGSNLVDQYCYDQWTHIIDNIGETISSQERFFRNNYNAFRKELNGGDLSYPIARVANKNNLLDVYAYLTVNDAKDFLIKTRTHSDIYAKIILLDTEHVSRRMKYYLRCLNDADGTTSFGLLMYLFNYQTDLNISENDIIAVIQTLIKFQVRRNMTKVPSTNKMIPFYNSLLGEIDKNGFVGNGLISFITESIREFSASRELFEAQLRDNVFTTNKDSISLILKMLAHSGMTAENERDLWMLDDRGNPVWTIEHIFPQGDNIPQEWVNVIANGDAAQAKELQRRYVHTLGNLTITGYNSNLSNKPFIEKRDAINEEGLYIGYKNGLNLNVELANKDSWTIQDIKDRTDHLISRILAQFSI